MSDEMNYNKYKGIINTFTSKTYTLTNGFFPKEDLYQTFCVEYAKAIENYKEHKGESFYNYLRKLLTNKLKKIYFEYKTRNTLKEGGTTGKQYLSDNRFSPLKTEVCIYCHSKDSECFLDKENEIKGWKTSCNYSVKDSFECPKWFEERYNYHSFEVPLFENFQHEPDTDTKEISILMADCAKLLNEREMRIVRQILDSPEGHFDFMEFCEQEGVSHTVIARALDGLRDKMGIILGKE